MFISLNKLQRHNLNKHSTFEVMSRKLIQQTPVQDKYKNKDTHGCVHLQIKMEEYLKKKSCA